MGKRLSNGLILVLIVASSAPEKCRSDERRLSFEKICPFGSPNQQRKSIVVGTRPRHLPWRKCPSSKCSRGCHLRAATNASSDENTVQMEPRRRYGSLGVLLPPRGGDDGDAKDGSDDAAPWNSAEHQTSSLSILDEESTASSTPVKHVDTAIPPLRTQVVYRYYARQNVRTPSSGSIPFMLIGSNVDHWKVMGQQLSARGFNVIAVGPHHDVRSSHQSSDNDDADENQGPSMVLQLLDSLRWNQVVLVGCDSESTLAIEAAMKLAPHRVVGLILCGKLHDSEQRFVFARDHQARPRQQPPSQQLQQQGSTSLFELDRYLHTRLQCPFTIIWDGNTETAWKPSFLQENDDAILTENKLAADLHRHRTIILGGGTAPHRRRPEIFAWILTRFVEEKIAPPVVLDVSTPLMQSHRNRRSRQQQQHSTTSTTAQQQSNHFWSQTQSWRYPSFLPIPWRVNDMFNEESMVVFGRMAATALFYGMALRVLFYQYDNIRLGFDTLTTVRRNVLRVLVRRTSKLWSAVLFLWRVPRQLLGRLIAKDDATGESGDSQSDATASTSSIEDKQNSGGNNSIDDHPSIDTEPGPTDSNVRPFFFLDHVVA